MAKTPDSQRRPHSPFADSPSAGASLSIIMPAYNEARRIGDTLARIRDYFGPAAQPCEIIVVDDGSWDATADVVRAFEPGPLTLRMLENPVNCGKGYSVRRGVLVSAGERVLVCDADLSAPIEELEKLASWVERGFDIAIGSRDLSDSRLDPPQPAPRRLLAWGFRALRRRLLLPELRDTQCGFKLFRGSIARELFARLTIDGWLFDCEVLGLAARLGYRIREVGIVWRHHPHSRVRPLREVLRSLRDLMSIRRRLSHLGT